MIRPRGHQREESQQEPTTDGVLYCSYMSAPLQRIVMPPRSSLHKEKIFFFSFFFLLVSM